MREGGESARANESECETEGVRGGTREHECERDIITSEIDNQSNEETTVMTRDNQRVTQERERARETTSESEITSGDACIA